MINRGNILPEWTVPWEGALQRMGQGGGWRCRDHEGGCRSPEKHRKLFSLTKKTSARECFLVWIWRHSYFIRGFPLIHKLRGVALPVSFFMIWMWSRGRMDGIIIDVRIDVMELGGIGLAVEPDGGLSILALANKLPSQRGMGGLKKSCS